MSPVQPEDFRDAAHELNNRERISNEEMRMRTAVGRAYYAAYLQTRQAVRVRSGRRGERIRHAILCRALKGPGSPKNVQLVGTLLDTLRGLRDDADYELGKKVNKFDVGIAIAGVQQVFDLVSRYEAAVYKAYKGRAP